MIQYIKNAFKYMNEQGISFPFARYKGQPSVSLSLLVLSSFFVMLSLIGKQFNLQIAFWETLAWHVTCAVLYYNRGAKISKDGIELSASQSKDTDGQEGLNSGRKTSNDNGSVQG